MLSFFAHIEKIGKIMVSMSLKMMPDGIIMTGDDEPCSFIIGQVINFKDVKAYIADNYVEFKIIYLDTGVVSIPVAVNSENFDLNKLKKDTLIGMIANIKADLSE